jgi:glycosyltransferase involved in cell wall biosynthesis
MPDFLHPTDYPAFLCYLIASREPDVVMITNSELGYWLLPFLRTHCPEPTYVDYCHMEEEYWKDGGYPRYAVDNQDLLDLNIVASEHLKSWMVSRGGDPERIEVAHINVDPDVWKPRSDARRKMRDNFGIGDDQTLILYAGRLCEQKRPMMFARIMAAVAKQEARFVTLVAGDGPDRRWLEQYVSQSNLGKHVRLLGAQTIEQMRDLMNASDVLFLPSLWEGIALTIYEAMAAGVAILGAVVGGQRELVTPDCGILVERTDEQTELQRYTDELVALIRDPHRRREMGRRGRERIEREFTLNKMGDRMAEALARAQTLKREAPRATLPPQFAQECAKWAIEYQRLQKVADELWAERETWQKAAQPGQAAVPQECAASASVEDLIGRMPLGIVRSELDHIENSRSWQAVGRFKRMPPYRWLARLRFGDGWDKLDPNEDPRQRLVRIINSRPYRMIRAVKRIPMYRWYASRKYGPDYERSLFHVRAEHLVQ